MYITFLCGNKTGSHLYSLCTQHKRRRNPTAICDSTCRDHRDLYRIHNLWWLGLDVDGLLEAWLQPATGEVAHG